MPGSWWGSYSLLKAPSLSSSSIVFFSKPPHVFFVPLVKKSSSLSSFLPRSIILWNSLPSELQKSSSLSTFKSALKSHLCTQHRSHKFMHLSPSLSLIQKSTHISTHRNVALIRIHVLASLQSCLNISINQSIKSTFSLGTVFIPL